MGCQSASTHLRPVDSRLRTIALWDCSQNHGCALQTLFLLLSFSPCFRSDKMGMRVEDILPLDEMTRQYENFLLFSRVCHGRILIFPMLCNFLLITLHSRMAARIFLFLLPLFLFYVATFLGYKYCTK